MANKIKKNFLLGWDVQLLLLHDPLIQEGREYLCRVKIVRNDGKIPGGDYSFLRLVDYGTDGEDGSDEGDNG